MSTKNEVSIQWKIHDKWHNCQQRVKRKNIKPLDGPLKKGQHRRRAQSDSGSDDDVPLSSYRQPESNNRALPGPTEAEYLARYLSHRNKQLEVDTNTGNEEQHSKSKGGDHKDIASSTKTDGEFNTNALLQQLNAEKKKREILLADRVIADTKHNSLQKKLETEREETEREEMELTKDEHRQMEAEWKKMLEMSEAEKNALKATLEAEKKTRQILEAQQNYQDPTDANIAIHMKNIYDTLAAIQSRLTSVDERLS
ncbi:moesin-like [Acropora muricata]|uniref:moesin-like n=1 Tax=Acropora muricata TaxID=159855 RepID=UPI0034E50ECB